jgi:O-antigen biosynthesis protein WbqP
MAISSSNLKKSLHPRWKRSLDIVLSSILGLMAAPLFVLCYVAVRMTSPGPVLYWSLRIGKENQKFLMPKFRTMKVETPQLATHLLQESEKCVTRIGRLLRKSSLDELPQLFSVLKGDLSLVGPRPALFNQDDLVRLRTDAGVHRLVPGITGWAQINGRDELEIPTKVRFDIEYLHSRSLMFDLKILFFTMLRVLKSEGIKH